MKPILAALLVMFTAQAAAAETPIYEVPAASSDAAFYIVGPRDVIEITVYGEEQLSQVVTVSDTGDISVPFIGVQRVANMSPPEIARALDKAFQDGGFLVHPHTSVRVAEFRSQAVEIIGAVAKPGLYFLQGPTPLSRLIAEAGWIDLATASGQATVVHLDGSTEVVDLNDLTRPGSVAMNTLVARGDRISVGEGQGFYVSGQVAKVGWYPYKNGATALAALYSAGGATAVARLSGADVLRGEQRIPVNLKKILRGREDDVALEPGDKLYIPESAI